MIGGFTLTGITVSVGSKLAFADSTNDSKPFLSSDYSASDVRGCSDASAWDVYYYADIHHSGASRPIVADFTLGEYPVEQFQTGWAYPMAQGACQKKQVQLRNNGDISLTVSEVNAWTYEGMGNGIADSSGISYTSAQGSHPLTIEPNSFVDVYFWIGIPFGSSLTDVGGEWELRLDAGLTIHKYYAPDFAVTPGLNDGREIAWGTTSGTTGITVGTPECGAANCLTPVTGVTYRVVFIPHYCVDIAPPSTPLPYTKGNYDAELWDDYRENVWEPYIADCDSRDLEGQISQSPEVWKPLADEFFESDHHEAWAQFWDAVGWYHVEADTDANGEVKFDLPGAIFYVYEAFTPAGVAPGVPFYVMFPTPSGAGWNYNVHAYPKNEQFGLHKSIIGEYVLGSYPDSDGLSTHYDLKPDALLEDGYITYELTADIPKIDPTQNITKLLIMDQKDDGAWFPGTIWLGGEPYEPWDAFVRNSDTETRLIEGDDYRIGDTGYYEDCRYFSSGHFVGGYSGAVNNEADCIAAGGWWIPQRTRSIILTTTGLATVTNLATNSNTSGEWQLVWTQKAHVNEFGRSVPNGGPAGGESDHHDSTFTVLRLEIDGIEAADVPSNVVTFNLGVGFFFKYGAEKIAGKVAEEDLSLLADEFVFDDVGYCTDGSDVLTEYLRKADCEDDGGMPTGYEWVSIGLSGAKFSIYPGLCPGNPLTTPIEIALFAGDQFTTITTEVTTAAKDEYLSAGLAIMGGLNYGDYCLVEVSPPPGYARVATFNGSFTFSESGWSGGPSVYGSGPGWESFLVMPVPNMPATNAGFPFPITGGASSLIYALIAGVIVGGTLYVLRKQKKPAAA